MAQGQLPAWETVLLRKINITLLSEEMGSRERKTRSSAPWTGGSVAAAPRMSPDEGQRPPQLVPSSLATLASEAAPQPLLQPLHLPVRFGADGSREMPASAPQPAFAPTRPSQRVTKLKAPEVGAEC